MSHGASDSAGNTAKRHRTTDRPSRRKDRLQPEDDSPYRDLSSSSNNTMQRNSTSPDASGSLKYTKTGRVSKATKGERVHSCSKCGKVYTRAEHLRRHEKNHTTEPLPCDVPGCDQFFYREDLLRRHKAKHSEANADVNSALPITGSLPPAPGTAIIGAVATIEPIRRSSTKTQPSIATGHAEDVTDPTTRYVPTYDQYWDRATTRSNTVDMLRMDERIWSSRQDDTFGCTAVSQPYYGLPGLQIGTTITPSGTYSYQTKLRSPVSSETSFSLIPNIGEDVETGAYTNIISTPTSDLHIATTLSGRIEALPAWTTPPELRDLDEQSGLKTPTISDAAAFDSFIAEQRYMDGFWHAVHPLWPVVHQPTFNAVSASPLLKAAMICLGAQAMGNVDDFKSARILHERCIKILKKRTRDNSHSYRVCDMQALLLVELYSLYKARRPPKQLSSTFEDVLRHIATDPEAYQPAPVTNAFEHRYGDMEFVVAVHLETKRRLLIACHVLDRQHSILFARRPVSSSEYALDLPFPQPLEMWNATSDPSVNTVYGNVTNDQSMHEYTHEALDIIPKLEEPSKTPYDVFRSSHLVAGLKDVVEGQVTSSWKPLDDDEASALLYVVDHSSGTQLAYHTFMLCKNTPVRDMLAVAGESWIMAEKIANQTTYSAAQLEASNWARDKSRDSNHSNALYHALHILGIYRDSPTPGLLYRDWAVYLAALVIWLTAYVNNETLPRRRLSINGISRTAYELDKELLALVEAGSSTTITWANASCVLLWTHNKLRDVDVPGNYGLTNGALDVLNKLISRGHEDTWLQ